MHIAQIPFPNSTGRRCFASRGSQRSQAVSHASQRYGREETGRDGRGQTKTKRGDDLLDPRNSMHATGANNRIRRTIGSGIQVEPLKNSYQVTKVTETRSARTVIAR